MGKDNNIYIRVELSRDKNTGTLNLVTHFELNAPNVLNDSEGYFWFPTEEEKDLISDTFELMPSDAKSKPSLEKIEIKSSPKPEARPEPDLNATVEVIPPSHEPEQPTEPTPSEPPKEETNPPQQPISKPEVNNIPNPTEFTPTTPQSEPPTEETIQPPPQSEPPTEETIQPSPQSAEPIQEKEEKLPPLEPNGETKSGYEIAEQKIEEELQKRNQPQPEEKPKDENQEDKKTKEEDDGMIVKADSKAIEEALRRHSQEKDDSMVDVDEKTIIDKVLKQKKKWNKK